MTAIEFGADLTQLDAAIEVGDDVWRLRMQGERAVRRAFAAQRQTIA